MNPFIHCLAASDDILQNESTALSQVDVPTGEAASQPRLAPTAKLAPKTLTLLLIATCLVPLITLSGYAMFFGKARDAPLDVQVMIAKEPVEAVGGQGAILADVIVIENLTDHELPNLTVNLNGQYFLYRDSPVLPGERLVFPQSIFATKSNQRWVPGRYRLTKINVTAKLPSGKRGVKIVKYD
jgi:hypothetical protein